jgi:hypothetical protein
VGDVISLDAFRARRDRRTSAEVRPAALARLEAATHRLDRLVRQGHRLRPHVSAELVVIARAVDAGFHREAAERAERLLGLLEHPLASG